MSSGKRKGVQIHMSFTAVAMNRPSDLQPGAPVNLQDAFLSAARRSAARVTVFLMNGDQLRGVITAYDPYVVSVSSDGRQQLIYKHAISTIAPERPLELK